MYLILGWDPPQRTQRTRQAGQDWGTLDANTPPLVDFLTGKLKALPAEAANLEMFWVCIAPLDEAFLIERHVRPVYGDCLTCSIRETGPAADHSQDIMSDARLEGFLRGMVFPEIQRVLPDYKLSLAFIPEFGVYCSSAHLVLAIKFEKQTSTLIPQFS